MDVLAVLSGRQAGTRTEVARQVTLVGEAGLLRDIRHRHACPQENTGADQPELILVSVRGKAIRRAKPAAEFEAAQSGDTCQVVQRYGRSIPRLQILARAGKAA